MLNNQVPQSFSFSNNLQNYRLVINNFTQHTDTEINLKHFVGLLLRCARPSNADGNPLSTWHCCSTSKVTDIT